MAADMAAQPRSDELSQSVAALCGRRSLRERPTAARTPLRRTAASGEARGALRIRTSAGAAPTCSSSGGRPTRTRRS